MKYFFAILFNLRKKNSADHEAVINVLKTIKLMYNFIVLINKTNYNKTIFLLFVCRLVLRCRQLARKRFAALREDVLAKIELLENKHVHDVVGQLHAISLQTASYNREISRMMLGGGNNDDSEPPLFPIEMDLTQSAFQYESVQPPINELYQDDKQNVRK